MPYTEEFYREHRDTARRSASRIVPLLRGLFDPKSVLDVGCGDGTWLSEWAQCGVTDFFGVDGEYVRPVLQIPTVAFGARDLTTAFDLQRKFDLVTSLEVAEHLPEAAASTFVESLIRHGELIVFSAAVPGQFGADHVNEQWPSYWASLFAARGFRVFDVVRPRIWTDTEIAWWYRQNMLIFCSERRISRHPVLASFEGGAPLAIAHPDFMRYFRDSLRSDTSIRLLAGKIYRLIRQRLSDVRRRWLL